MGLCKDGYWRESESYDGKQYIGCGKTQRDAMKELSQKISNAKAGINVLNNNTTVREWSKQWLEVYVKPRVRKPGQPKLRKTMTEKSYKMYTEKLDGHILPIIGHLKLKDVKDTHLQKVENAQSGMSKSHAEKVRIVMKALFRQAYKSRLIHHDPSEDIELPAVTEGKRRSLTEEERELMLKACEIHRCGLWIRLLLDAGPRPGETAPLQIKDFDFKTDLLSINKDIESGTYCVSDPKTKAGIRKLPIPEDLKKDLLIAFAGKSPFDIAFPQINGMMKTQSCIDNDWRSLLRCANILGGAKTTWRGKVCTISKDGYKATARGRIMTLKEDGENGSVLADDLVLYNLRHTYCTDLQRAGVPINIASYLMGHADIQTTAKIYTHTGERDAKTAAVSINKYRNKISENTDDIKKDIKIG